MGSFSISVDLGSRMGRGLQVFNVQKIYRYDQLIRKKKNMKNLRLKIFALLALAMTFASNAFAILDADATAAIASISTFVTDIIAAVWPLAAAVAVGAIGIKLFKKFTGKAT